jgi:hypothetical protein
MILHVLLALIFIYCKHSFAVGRTNEKHNFVRSFFFDHIENVPNKWDQQDTNIL